MVRPPALDKARAWTWASYDGGPFGRGIVLCHGERVHRVELPITGEWRRMVDVLLEGVHSAAGAVILEGGAAEVAAGRLAAAFRDGSDVTDLPIDPPANAGSFTHRLWDECRRIPRGSTISYRELARRAGNEQATRPAGNAMATNRLPLIIPCHRVVNADGSLGNYGGGAEMKRWLLRLEGALPEFL